MLMACHDWRTLLRRRSPQRSSRRMGHGALVLGVVAAMALPSVVFASDSDANLSNAQTELTAVDRDSNSIQGVIDRANALRTTPEQKLANGELLYRSGDHARATVMFSEVIEEFPNTPSAVDALWLRGESYYAAKEYLSARRDFRALVERSSEVRFAPYLPRALARLVDVSLRLNDLSGLDEVFARLNQVPPNMVDAGLNYAKGKAYYAKKDYAAAQSALALVAANTPYTHQARYFEGLVAIRTAAPAAVVLPVGAPAPTAGASPVGATSSANYRAAIEAFKRVTELPGDTADHKQVVDLGWLAVARLFYEMEQYQQAAEAYQRVDRASREFDTMLYELAWTYVRMGDVQRAERALEVLSVSDPTSALLGEGSLLRADLLLRSGSFRKALTLYESVKDKYEPLRAKVESFLDSTTEPSVYYEKLSQQQLDVLDQTEVVPPIAVKWAREAEDGAMAFAVIDDVNQCKTLIKQSNVIIEKLTAVISAGNRVRAVPELLAGEEHALGLINRISLARLELARGLDAEESSDLGGEIGRVRTARRNLMAQLQGLPANSGDFAARDYAGNKQWNAVSQAVTIQSFEVDRLNAVINGLRRMLRDDAQRGVARDAQAVAKMREELDNHERDLKRRPLSVGRRRTAAISRLAGKGSYARRIRSSGNQLDALRPARVARLEARTRGGSQVARIVCRPRGAS
jgi:tetratricopeptide (TPR) repeat protein